MLDGSQGCRIIALWGGDAPAQAFAAGCVQGDQLNFGSPKVNAKVKLAHVGRTRLVVVEYPRHHFPQGFIPLDFWNRVGDIFLAIGGGCARRAKIALDTGQLVIVECHSELLFDAGFIAGFVGIDIIPTVMVEVIFHERVAHDEGNLAFGHAGFKLVDHVLREDIALIDVYPVNERHFKVIGTRSGGQTGD